MRFSIFGLTGYGYGLAAGISALGYLSAVLFLSRKPRRDAETVLLYGVLGFPLGLFFARLLYCTVNIAYFTQVIAQPIRMLSFWDGGYSMAGMLAGLVLAALITARFRKLNPRVFLDTAMLPAGILLFGLRLAERLTGTLGIGRHVEPGAIAQSLPVLFLSETMGTMELYRLAVFRYEAVFALLLFAGLLWVAKASKRRRDGRYHAVILCAVRRGPGAV